MLEDKPTFANISAAILAGGKATRMHGFPKGEIRVKNNLTIMQRLIKEIVKVGIKEMIIIANNKRNYEKYGLPIIADKRCDAGPLAGIESALDYYQNKINIQEKRATLFLPCDLPKISAYEIITLLNEFAATPAPIVFATSGSHKHPLCAVVANPCLPMLSAALDQGIRKVMELWAKLGAEPIYFAEATAFYNINGFADLEAWEKQQ